MTAALEVQHLRCQAGQTLLLSGIHFTLAPGEFLAVIGRNGAGKSTLLDHLTGERTAPEGEVRVLGEPLHRHPRGELARRRAVVPQSTSLPFAYETLEVVMLGRIPHQRHGPESPEDVRIVSACLARVGLAGYEGRDYLTLSGGEQQRVHLARALAQLHGPPGPRLLFLDEPTSSLDVAHQHRVLECMKALTAEGSSSFPKETEEDANFMELVDASDEEGEDVKSEPLDLTGTVAKLGGAPIGSGVGGGYGEVWRGKWTADGTSRAVCCVLFLTIVPFLILTL